jgi:hypothetical protein
MGQNCLKTKDKSRSKHSSALLHIPGLSTKPSQDGKVAVVSDVTVVVVVDIVVRVPVVTVPVCVVVVKLIVVDGVFDDALVVGSFVPSVVVALVSAGPRHSLHITGHLDLKSMPNASSVHNVGCEHIPVLSTCSAVHFGSVAVVDVWSPIVDFSSIAVPAAAVVLIASVVDLSSSGLAVVEEVVAVPHRPQSFGQFS